MNFKSLIVILLFTAAPLPNFAQSKLDNILRQISGNNLQIKAGSELASAKRTGFNIGLAPYDPFISYEYLFGSPQDVGNETEFAINFTFDFPTVYGKKNTLSDLKSAQINYDEQILKQEILLEAKLTCIELTYLNKKDVELNRRYSTAENVYNYMNTKLEQGDINIMDVNKAKLQLISYKSEIEINKTEIERLNSKLTELNGGKQISFSDTIYPEHKSIPDFVSLENEIEISDPVLKRLNFQYKIIKQEIDVNEALRLPKIELGYKYRYQGISNEKYNGIRAGISIPLWERNNTVKTKELESIYAKTLIESHENEHHYEIKQLYEQYTSLHNTLSETNELLGAINNYELYKRALFAGEISSIEYLMETTYQYSIHDKVYMLEKEFNIIIAKLLMHRLLEEY